MNNKFKVNQKVICTIGTNKGKVFTIKAIMKDSYSCILDGSNDGKYYRYTDSTLTNLI